MSIKFRRNNLGGDRPKNSGIGAISVYRGVTALEGLDLDVFKIAVAGLGIGVPNRLSETIARCQPRIFAEVDSGNTQAFLAAFTAHLHVIAERFRPYSAHAKFLIMPAG